MEDSARAEALFRRAIDLAPGHAEAHNNLGVVLAEQGKLNEAVAAYRKAVALAPGAGEFSYNLGNALRRMERIDAAIDAYADAVKATPEHFASWQGLVCTLNLAGREQESARVLDQLEGLRPGDPIIAYLRATSLGDAVPERAPDDYVKHLFDEAADSFDRHLASLGYRAPALSVEALAPFLGDARGDLLVLDAGCGTGLCGPLLRPYAATLVGVDLSEGMLKRAAQREIYDDLYQSELTRFLEQAGLECDLIVSADTLCYFGRLDAVLAASAKSLKSGGLLSFTVEAAPEGEGDFQLGNSGRYTHCAGYLRETLAGAGFQVASFETVVLRMERKAPVTGYLVVARKGGE